MLAGCTVGPKYHPPTAAQLKVPAAFATMRPAPLQAEAELTHWWKAFDDPLLAELVERGLAANLDIDAAGARLRQARAGLRAARGARLPSLSVGGSVARSIGNEGATVVGGNGQIITTGGDRTVFDAGFDAAYEADLFGGLRRSEEAARADSEAARADLRATQLGIAAEVALNYLDARAAQERLRIARRNLAALDETLEIVGFRVQAGLVGSLDLEQARQLRAQTAASLPALENAETQALNRLAVLLAEPPGTVNARMRPPASIPLAPTMVPAETPADVLRRRPDVEGAERSLAAAVARIGVAEAELYPALRLAGSFGGSATSLGDVISASVGNVVASLTAPLFQGGRLRAQVEGQRAAADAALASYRQTVLLALEDVENALAAINAAERRERELVTADEAARSAVILARAQYRAGLIDFQALLESERGLLSSQDSRVAARADRAVATVQLYKALGGGWQSAPQPASVTTSSFTGPR